MSIRGNRDTLSFLSSGTPASSGITAAEVREIIGAAEKWVQIASLTGTSEVRRLLWVDSTHFYAATNTSGDVYKSTDNGATWANSGNLASAITMQALVSNSNDGNLFASAYNGPYSVVYKSTDVGANWTATSGFGATFTFVNALFFDASFYLYAVTSNAGKVYKTTDSGANWSLYSSPAAVASAYCAVTDADGIVYMGVENDSGVGSVLVSSDAGVNWTANALTGTTEVIALALGDNGVIFAGASGSSTASLYKSEDSGATWELVGQPYARADRINKIVVDDRGYIYAALGTAYGSKGVFMSVDDGETWQPTGEMLEVKEVNDIITDTSGNLYACSWPQTPASDGRIYKRTR